MLTVRDVPLKERPWSLLGFGKVFEPGVSFGGEAIIEALVLLDIMKTGFKVLCPAPPHQEEKEGESHRSPNQRWDTGKHTTRGLSLEALAAITLCN